MTTRCGRDLALSLSVAGLVLLAAPQARAASVFRFVEILRDGDVLPVGNVTDIPRAFQAGAADNANVAVLQLDLSTNPRWVYAKCPYVALFAGCTTIDIVADESAVIAGEPPPHTVTAFDAFAIDRGLSMNATYYFQSTPSIALVADGAPATLIAQVGDPIPEGGGASFLAFLSDVAIGATHAIFVGYGPAGLEGIYSYRLSDGLLARVADSTQPRPRGAGTFAALSSVAADATRVAWTDAAGAYVAPLDGSSAPVQPAAQGDSYAPGRALRAVFGQVVIDGPRVVFQGTSEAFASGIYEAEIAAPGTVARVADDETPVPEGAGNFGLLQNPAAAGDRVLFEGFSATFQYLGTYESKAGVPGVFLRRNDPLLGKLVQTAVVGSRGVTHGGGHVSMAVYYTDGTTAFVVAYEVLLLADFEEGDLSEWSSHLP